MTQIIHFLNPQTNRFLVDIEKMIFLRGGKIAEKMILLKQQFQIICMGLMLRDTKSLVKRRIGHDDFVFLICKAYAVCDIINDRLGHIFGINDLTELPMGDFQRLDDVIDIVSGNLIGQVPRKMKESDDGMDGGDIGNADADVDHMGDAGGDQLGFSGGDGIVDIRIDGTASRIIRKKMILGKSELPQKMDHPVGTGLKVIDDVDESSQRDLKDFIQIGMIKGTRADQFMDRVRHCHLLMEHGLDGLCGIEKAVCRRKMIRRDIGGPAGLQDQVIVKNRRQIRMHADFCCGICSDNQ